MTRSVLLLALVLSLWPLAGCASQDAVRPPQRPDADRSSTPVVVRGELDATDAVREDGQPFDLIHATTWAPGETIRVRMESETVDTVVLIEIVGEDRALENDDYDGVEFASAEGLWRSYLEETNTSGRPLEIEIRASSYLDEEYGAYVVWYEVSPTGATRPESTRDDPTSSETRQVEPSLTRPDFTVQGEIENSDATVTVADDGETRIADSYEVHLRDGDRVTIHMAANRDTYLVLKLGDEIIRSDYTDPPNKSDNVGLSRVVFDIEETGTYTVVTAFLDPDARGTYSAFLTTE